MRILSFYPTKTFKLIMGFENNEYRILDIQIFLQKEQGLLKDLCNDINLFMSAELDAVVGTIRWSNGVDVENNLLYEASQDLDILMKGNRNILYPRNPRKITRLGDNSQSRLSKENQRLIKLIRGYKL
ncbi:DUF2442 domain-containing protein [Robertmurraya massiliosenegalensis]|uniref:DUF2442 domain-containing protein n=1 Tax=Robertmurraya massiliosenegalensis TaxID=1287657 RepID=UPI000318E911|nr:DUF2442 domain-containing protein [Robertmurraya massiliosenegalensis]